MYIYSSYSHIFYYLQLFVRFLYVINARKTSESYSNKKIK